MGSVICVGQPGGQRLSGQGLRFRFQPLARHSDQGQPRRSQRQPPGRLPMSAILVTPEYWWLEAGSSSDVIITGNTDSRLRRRGHLRGGHGRQWQRSPRPARIGTSPSPATRLTVAPCPASW